MTTFFTITPQEECDFTPANGQGVHGSTASEFPGPFAGKEWDGKLSAANSLSSQPTDLFGAEGVIFPC